jgi:hypothetical protein
MVKKVLESKEFLLGVPAGHLGYTQFYSHLIRWMSGSPVMPLISQSNRVDVNRSQLISGALKAKRNLIMLDHDALPMTDYATTIKYLLEDFEEFDIVVAPVRGLDGNVLISPLEKGFTYPKHIADFKTFEIEAGSFTLAGISYNLMKQLKPISQYGLVSGEFIPLYTQYTNQTSEEYNFCRTSRKKYDAKIGCDPRIRVAHYKTIPLEPPMSIEEIMARQEELKKKQEASVPAPSLPKL